ncbi:hypothetical protein WISP_91378 [Willisornis vidua]|uniref:ribonuclease H n=1 Tax=Willisornis vidua TaxID=1566151 RepID=A0ABQ9D791_9PASS|nr:hypothetical protein WISP_91378 [Willisornis vidua]
MCNSPVICQTMVANAVQAIRKHYPPAIVYHYMDDILMAAVQEKDLHLIMKSLTTAIREAGLQVAPEKIQQTQPQTYLGWCITLQGNYTTALGTQGRERLQAVDGQDPRVIYIPVTKDNLTWLLADVGFQAALVDYSSDLSILFPKHWCILA